MLDTLLFVVLPYAALLIAVVMTAMRISGKGYTVTSLSSQFLEGGELFYGSIPWHYGIIGALTGHLIGFLIPAQVLEFNSVPVRLYILETTGFLFGLLSLAGIVSLVVRRATTSRIRAVTSRMDVIILVLLLLQVATGVYTAIFSRWGSSWYASAAVPYLWSLCSFQPDVSTIAPLPWVIKTHIVNVYLIVALVPFSRLIHATILPLQYLWRPYELVIWNSARRNHLAPHRIKAAVRRGADVPEREEVEALNGEPR